MTLTSAAMLTAAAAAAVLVTSTSRPNPGPLKANAEWEQALVEAQSRDRAAKRPRSGARRRGRARSSARRLDEHALTPSTQRAVSPQRVVRDYYAALDGRRFRDAWSRLDASVQQGFGSFASWRHGYRRTRGHRLTDLRVTSEAGGAHRVTLVLEAADATPCGAPVARTFAVVWRLMLTGGDWRAIELRATKLTGEEPAEACT
jgi:hypothetical protein